MTKKPKPKKRRTTAATREALRAPHDAAVGLQTTRKRSSNSGDWRIGRPKGTGTQRVYAQVREDIMALRIAPGADVDEASLERRFGVSRTPVREALIRLASEGLIRLLPNRGARVTEIDINEIPEIFTALDLCQRATIRWAALRRSDDDLINLRKINASFLEAAQLGNHELMGEHNKEFHTVIADACRNRYFAGLYTSLLAISLRLARTVFAYAPMSGESAEEYYLEIVHQHEEMICAIEARDVEKADAFARVHTDLFRDRITRYVNANPDRGITLETIT